MLDELVTKNVNAVREAVSSIAWLDRVAFFVGWLDAEHFARCR
jgi:hypothetical protein